MVAFKVADDRNACGNRWKKWTTRIIISLSSTSFLFASLYFFVRVDFEKHFFPWIFVAVGNIFKDKVFTRILFISFFLSTELNYCKLFCKGRSNYSKIFEKKHCGKPQNWPIKERNGIDPLWWGTGYFGSGGCVFGSMVAHMEPAERICCDNAANDLPSASVILNCGSILTPWN